MIWLTLIGSVATLYPFNKFVGFGSGSFPFLIKIACNFLILTAPSVYINIKMRERMLIVKKKAFEANRPAFRRFELTGDMLEINEGYELVDE